MANILKDTKTYIDIRGVIYDDAYMVIDRSSSQALPVPSVMFDLNIYKDSQSRLDGLQPIFSAQVTMTPANIVAYVGTPKDAADQEVPLSFIKKWIYNFLGTELPAIPSIVWADWKSDEIGGVPQTLVHK